MKIVEKEIYEKLKEEIDIAKNVRKNAKVPYSDFRVGTALKAKSGKVYSGCNIENHGIQAICGERVAFTKALSEGENEFEYIIVMGGYGIEDPKEICLPCGYCRQFMSEYVDRNFKIYAYYNEILEEYSMEELLPYGFKLEE